jgi:hypothetical protein
MDFTGRPTPSNREKVNYAVIPGHGATDIDYTRDQTHRCHEEAKDPEAKAVSFETVRSQVKSIFSKTNSKLQGELIRLLLDHAAQDSDPTK